jgi:predicted Zn-dependent peptidase
MPTVKSCRRVVTALAVCLALLALPVTPLSARTGPPKLVHTTTKLANGLWVVLHEDDSTPIVHVELQYHVGSKNEPPGRTGFAHLFEHLMFQGSRNVSQDQHQAFIASVGGESNASTNEDATVYWQTVPSHYLPLALWLEADRMASLKVDEAAFARERSVVKEERRQKIENQPYGRLAEIVYDQAFKVHPYKHQVMGSMKDLEAATINDVRDFYETFYVPENAVLVIAGAIDSAETLKLVEQYFGRIPKAKKPIPRDIPKEPAVTKPASITIYEDVPLPAVVVAHHITFDGHPDSYPLHIVNKVLSDGQSSRIHRSLVYEKRLALAAFGGGNIIEHPNLFFATAIVQPGVPHEKVTDALAFELDRLRTEPISDRELERTKNQFARDYILGRITVQQKAGVLAHAAVIHNDLSTADGEFDIFMKITKDDVQRVAKTYFTPESRLVITILPKSAAPTAGVNR